jgi:hypothetical protein
MSQANLDARAKAVRLCGGGAPGMRRHREDGGGTSGGLSDQAFSFAKPDPAPPTAKSTDAKMPTVAVEVGTTPTGAPKELNADALRRGGRARRAR